MRRIASAVAAMLMTCTAQAAEGVPEAVTGEQVFAHWCAGCHLPLGERRKSLAGTTALTRRFGGARPGPLQERDDLTAAYIKLIVRKGFNAMPRTRKTEVSDAQLDAVANYLGRGK